MLQSMGLQRVGHDLATEVDSLVAQLVRNLLAMWEIWVQSLGWEDPLEKETAASVLAWRIPETV